MLRMFECAGELAALNERLAGGDAITARKRIDYLRSTIVPIVICPCVRGCCRLSEAIAVHVWLPMAFPLRQMPLLMAFPFMHAESARYIGRASSLQPPNTIQPSPWH